MSHPEDPAEIAALWYKDGLRFACQACGECCRGPGGYVWLSEAEAAALAQSCDLPLEDFHTRYTRQVRGRLALLDGAEGDCIFLQKNGACAHYHARPQQCRTFPWWPEMLQEQTSWQHSPYNCPGLDQGEKISALEIRRRLQFWFKEQCKD